MIKEINRFHQKPIGEDCPRYQTRQYKHPEYGFFEVTVDECESEDIEEEFNKRVEKTIEDIQTMREAEDLGFILETEDGEEILV